ncbi:hypothetical protein A1O3_02358 [Capronia epimyces CBS 606.96]|uniref:Fe2OG dioxygenase domain-containing protein n=1 Tax=Capronia epimyces CBS 606.96 TaxID=1182542 RepID=W9Y8W7_9EURO|nr:uncharacterized protein A1O3_02358 [Capronia epimyces CBS 606.96]EXJ89292.1 hypothetical protein A1O3_02358 [Capronia epimyces CBS 606.96]
MAQRTTLTFGDSGIRTSGIFSRPSDTLTSARQPLLVLIHGGGTNASYFDNDEFHSVPTDFNKLGFDVLNINRTGYGGNPIPNTATPIFDSIPVYADFIAHVYQLHGSQGGIVLIGHSLGAAISLIIAAQHGNRLPLLGVSALGVIPSKTRPKLGIFESLKSNPGNERVPRTGPPSAQDLRAFLGAPEFFDLAKAPATLPIFEDAVVKELLEWLDPATQDRLITEIGPAVQVPLQYLAAEIEISWNSLEEGRPIFDEAKKIFTHVPRLDSDILLGGGHNYEFSVNSQRLLDRRVQFIRSLVSSPSPSEHHDHDHDPDPASFQRVPVLDLDQAQSPDTRPLFLQQLRNALLHVGFFYLKNTGIYQELTHALISKTREFFDLPLEEKLKVEMVNSKHFLGYARLGTEITAQKSDFREQIDFATELPAPGPSEPVYRNLRGPNQWPAEHGNANSILGFRDTIERYLSQATNLSQQLTRLIAESLEISPDSFDGLFDTPNHNKLKLIKYPPPKPDDRDVQGVGPHQDYCFLTLLLQASDHRGLEVQNKSGDWIPASPIPDTLVINIGRALEAVTGGLCKATTHRVNLNAENFVDGHGRPLGPRYSMPVFQGLSLDLSAKDIRLQIPQHVKDLVQDQEIQTKAERTFNDMFQRKLGEGTFLARLTSHKDVAQRWYPELLQEALRAQQVFKENKRVSASA